MKSAFKRSGISPFSRNVFDEDEFLACFVSDRPSQDIAGPSTNAADLQAPGEQEILRASTLSATGRLRFRVGSSGLASGEETNRD